VTGGATMRWLGGASELGTTAVALSGPARTFFRIRLPPWVVGGSGPRCLTPLALLDRRAALVPTPQILRNFGVLA